MKILPVGLWGLLSKTIFTLDLSFYLNRSISNDKFSDNSMESNVAPYIKIYL